MIVSAVLEGRYNIGVANDTVKLNESKVKLEDIPFVRYRFSNYGEEDLEYIKKSMSKFKFSTHVAEVTLHDGCVAELSKLSETFENLAIFLYIPVDDVDVSNNDIKSEYKDILASITEEGIFYDRIMIKDMSTTLFTVSANKIKGVIRKITGDSLDKIGICCSPLSRYDGQCCLTALRARELAAQYNENAVAVPSSKSECKNECNCGCIAYKVIKADMPAPISNTEHKVKEKGSTENKEVKPKKPVKKSNITLSVW